MNHTASARKGTGKVSRIVRVVMLLSLAMLSAAGTAADRKMYRWVDKNGNVFYGDKIPPEYAAQGNEELSKQGVVVKTTAPPKTPEQLAEEQRQAALKAEADKRAREKAAHDRMLLNTFGTEEDLVMTRDGKIATIDAMISATKSRNESLKASMAGLRAAAAERERNGQPMTDRLRKDIESTRAQIQANLDYIASKQREQEQLRTQFEADLERFRELKAGPAQAAQKPAPAAPAPATPSPKP